MSQNIEKAIYLAAAALLFSLALVSFISSFNQLETYLVTGRKLASEDIMVRFDEAAGSCEATGSEVLHQVLERKKQRELSRFSDAYEDSFSDISSISPGTEKWPYTPEIFIKGKPFHEVEPEAISPARSYHVNYVTNSEGVITEIHYE